MTNLKLFEIIVKDKKLRNYVYPDTWFIGSTEVFPYTFWDNKPDSPRIDIQLDTSLVYRKSRNYYRFYSRYDRRLSDICHNLVTKYSDRIKWYGLNAQDGSCPPTITFCLEPDGNCKYGKGVAL